MTSAKELAYAKINLFLDVISKREDGFHDIKSVMHSVGLADTVVVSTAPSKYLDVKISVSDSRFVPEDSRNLAVIAAKLFCETLDIKARILIKIDKKIPVSAGLAGGSTDAAATLRALNRIYKHPFSQKALCELGAKIGSDVPFCIVGKTSLCEGRGEILTPIESVVSYHIVVGISSEKVSTPQAYKWLDEEYSDFDGSVRRDNGNLFDAVIRALNTGTDISTGLFNIFEQPAFSSCPDAKRIKGLLLEYGASGALMSGSGPSVFGIFDTKQNAVFAKEILIRNGFAAYYMKSV